MKQRTRSIALHPAATQEDPPSVDPALARAVRNYRRAKADLAVVALLELLQQSPRCGLQCAPWRVAPEAQAVANRPQSGRVRAA